MHLTISFLVVLVDNLHGLCTLLHSYRKSVGARKTRAVYAVLACDMLMPSVHGQTTFKALAGACMSHLGKIMLNATGSYRFKVCFFTTTQTILIFY